jgi:hypothetical protein
MEANVKELRARTRFSRVTLPVIVCLLFLQVTLVSQSRPQPDPKDVFTKIADSAAAAIYKIAWPTATYKHCELAEIRPANSGFDVIVKLSGLSGWDNSDLWLFLGFAFRDGDFKNMWVVKHNGNWPPFATANALRRAGEELLKEYEQSVDQAGAVCLINATNSPLAFSYRWGDGPWQDGKLLPGSSYMFWWPYGRGSEHVSPPFQISYDDSFEDGYTEQRYTLDRYATKLPLTCPAAKEYRFTTDGTKIFLRSIN